MYVKCVLVLIIVLTCSCRLFDNLPSHYGPSDGMHLQQFGSSSGDVYSVHGRPFSHQQSRRGGRNQFNHHAGMNHGRGRGNRGGSSGGYAGGERCERGSYLKPSMLVDPWSSLCETLIANGSLSSTESNSNFAPYRQERPHIANLKPYQEIRPPPPRGPPPAPSGPPLISKMVAAGEQHGFNLEREYQDSINDANDEFVEYDDHVENVCSSDKDNDEMQVAGTVQAEPSIEHAPFPKTLSSHAENNHQKPTLQPSVVVIRRVMMSLPPPRVEINTSDVKDQSIL